MSKLKGKNSSMKIRRPTAVVAIRSETKQTQALGHLDEVNDLRKGGTKITGASAHVVHTDRSRV